MMMVNGHVYPEVERGPLNYKYHQPRLFYWNAGGGKFKDMSNTAGPGISEPWASRGLAVGDLANDGSLEVVINNLDTRPESAEEFRHQEKLADGAVRRNQEQPGWRGGRVYVYVGDHRISGEIQTGASFLSQNDPRVHVGLGDETSYQRIEVQWLGGQREVFPGGKANQIVV